MQTFTSIIPALVGQQNGQSQQNGQPIRSINQDTANFPSSSPPKQFDLVKFYQGLEITPNEEAMFEALGSDGTPHSKIKWTIGVKSCSSL